MRPHATARNRFILERYDTLRTEGKTIDDAIWVLFEQGWGISWERLRAVCINRTGSDNDEPMYNQKRTICPECKREHCGDRESLCFNCKSSLLDKREDKNKFYTDEELYETVKDQMSWPEFLQNRASFIARSSDKGGKSKE